SVLFLERSDEPDVVLAACSDEGECDCVEFEIEESATEWGHVIIFALWLCLGDASDLSRCKSKCFVGGTHSWALSLRVRQENLCRARLDDRVGEARIEDVGGTLRGEDDGGVLLPHRLEPFADLVLEEA